jgi:hypothetical protein
LPVNEAHFGFIPDWMLWLRLPLQAILGWIIWRLAVIHGDICYSKARIACALGGCNPPPLPGW